MLRHPLDDKVGKCAVSYHHPYLHVAIVGGASRCFVSAHERTAFSIVVGPVAKVSRSRCCCFLLPGEASCI